MRRNLLTLAMLGLVVIVACDDIEHQNAIWLQLDVVSPAFDKAALLIDDYVRPGLSDCDHDAIVRPMVEHATAPHRAAGEDVDFFNFYQTVACVELSTPGEIELTMLARYRTVFWNVASSGQPSGLSTVVPTLQTHFRSLTLSAPTCAPAGTSSCGGGARSANCSVPSPQSPDPLGPKSTSAPARSCGTTCA